MLEVPPIADCKNGVAATTLFCMSAPHLIASVATTVQSDVEGKKRWSAAILQRDASWGGAEVTLSLIHI